MWKGIFRSIFYFIFSPQKGWIKKREENHQDFLNYFLFPVFGLVAITTFIGGMWMAENGEIRGALKQTIVVISAIFGGFYAASYLLNEIFPTFGFTKDLEVAQRFVGYSSVVLYLLFFVTPLLLGFEILWIAAIYTVYIVYAGATEFPGLAENKRLSFTVIASLLIVLMPILIKTLMELIIKLLPN